MRGLIAKIASGILGLWVASHYVMGVEFTGNWKILLFAGAALGLINFFIKPILNLVTLPLRMVTLGLFGLLINVVIIWLMDIFFVDLVIAGIVPLLWTTLIIWGLNLIISLFFKKA